MATHQFSKDYDAIGIGMNEDGESDYVTNPNRPLYSAWCVERI